MERHELQELYYIAPINNVPSILGHGILSHGRARLVPHESIAMQEIQDRRASVRVPGGRPLHHYANLYICARNPMLYKRGQERETICVLSVTADVLDAQGVVIADSNASSEYVRFAAGPAGLRIVDRDETFAQYWTDSDPIQHWRKKAAKCAEVLVPDRIDARFIRGAYVCSEEAKARLARLVAGLSVTVDRHLFFL